MRFLDKFLSSVSIFLPKFNFGKSQSDAEEGIYRVLFEESIDKSYSILDVNISNDKIIFCETWGGPQIERDWGDFDQEWFVTIEDQQRSQFIKKLCKKAKASGIKNTDNQKIVELIAHEFGNQASSITPIKSWLEQERISYQFDSW